MAALAPLLIGSLSATAATGSALSLGSLLSIGSTAVAGFSNFAASRFESQVAKNNAQIADDNAKRVIFESQIAAQDQDIQARGELGFILAKAGASGLNAGAGSIAGRRRSLTELAAKDRGRIRNEGDVQASRSRQQASDLRGQAKFSKRTSLFSAIGGGIDIGSSLVSRATQVNKRKAQRIVR